MGENELKEFLTFKLGLSNNANFNKEELLQETGLPLRIDYVIEDGGILYIVELKSRANINSMAQLVLSREWLKDLPGEKRFILAGKRTTPGLERIGKKMGIEVLELPYDIELHEGKGPAPRKGKITSEKSWRVIARLLKEKGISIRKLSIKTEVSYAWTHATVQNLLNRGIATRKGNYVRITDVPQLLNGIAWERPFEELFHDEIYIDYDNAYQAAGVLTNLLKKHDVSFSFTAYTAAGQYTSYGRRYDTLYMYIDKAQAEKFKREFKDKTGIKLRLYLPDRDVFKESHEIDGIRVVSLEQLILDMGGLGYSGRDITKALVDEYGRH
jgi:DNA-binding Lrp family transcriptional regulator